MQGTLRLDDDCLVLESADNRLALTFDGYSVADDRGTPVLVADDDGRTLAADGATVVLTGHRRAGGAEDACGTPFLVDSFNSVLE